ncbi:MAG TPA: twin transmembrane helix small protein [Acetobacteraceae bacterium]|nr:twin transmembrane helix small protein [Acetobacteraceae bacterium]
MGWLHPDLEHPAWSANVGDVKTFLTIVVILLMIGTLGVLFAGLIGLARGSPDAARSNRLMRWRVILQGSAILLLLILMSLLRS